MQQLAQPQASAAAPGPTVSAQPRAVVLVPAERLLELEHASALAVAPLLEAPSPVVDLPGGPCLPGSSVVLLLEA